MKNFPWNLWVNEKQLRRWGTQQRQTSRYVCNNKVTEQHSINLSFLKDSNYSSRRQNNVTKMSQLTSTARIKPYPALFHPSPIPSPLLLPLLFSPVFTKTSTASRHHQQSTTNTCLSEHSVDDGRIPVTRKSSEEQMWCFSNVTRNSRPHTGETQPSEVITLQAHRQRANPQLSRSRVLYKLSEKAPRWGPSTWKVV